MSKSGSDRENVGYTIRQREDGFVEVRDFVTGRLLEITYDPTFFQFMREQAELQELENQVVLRVIELQEVGLSPQNIERRLETEFRGADAIALLRGAAKRNRAAREALELLLRKVS